MRWRRRLLRRQRKNGNDPQSTAARFRAKRHQQVLEELANMGRKVDKIVDRRRAQLAVK